MRYYIDTCIWRDYWENRKDPAGKPLGTYAERFLLRVFKNKDVIMYSDRVVAELAIALSSDEINNMFAAFFAAGLLEKVEITEEIRTRAKDGPLHYADMLHVLLATEHDALLITRDKHFEHVLHKKPEELL